MAEPSRLSQPATISSTFPVSAARRPDADRGHDRSDLDPVALVERALAVFENPAVDHGAVGAAEVLQDDAASLRSIAAWSLLTMGEPRRNWQLRSRPIKNRDPETATLRPLEPPTWTLSHSPSRPGAWLTGFGRHRDEPGSRPVSEGAPAAQGAECPQLVVIADRISMGSVRGPDWSRARGCRWRLASSA